MKKYLKKFKFSKILYTMAFCKYTYDQILLATATAIGAYGGFPVPPANVAQFFQNEPVQWFLVWNLIYQGGSGQDVQLALLVTAAMYVFHKAASIQA